MPQSHCVTGEIDPFTNSILDCANTYDPQYSLFVPGRRWGVKAATYTSMSTLMVMAHTLYHLEKEMPSTSSQQVLMAGADIIKSGLRCAEGASRWSNRKMSVFAIVPGLVCARFGLVSSRSSGQKLVPPQ